MDDGRFDPSGATSFHVVSASFDAATRTATFSYAFEGGPEFVESVTFETPAPTPVDAEDPRLTGALRHLHIAAGTSYYKAAAPDRVVVDEGYLSPDEAEFHRHLYDDGLREFAVVNHLPVPRPVSVSAGVAGVDPPIRPARTATSSDRRPRVVVPLGGGKDSLVLAEALRPLEPRLFAVNPHPLVVDLAGQAGLELLVARRTLSPELQRLNRIGALNGHVPITAIVSLITVLGASIYDYDTIAMAVERSASEETVMVDGVPVNHQYSKSLAFEQLLRCLIGSSIDADLCYGSALRPYSELAISRAFAGLGRYQDTFCSCNVVFRQSGGASDGWCGQCAKCRFVALMLAPFLRRSALVSIMGADLLDDAGQVPGFEALMSREDKPFDCVGERGESAAAFRLLSEQDEWRETSVVAALGPRAQALVSDEEVAALLGSLPELAFPEPTVAAAVERFFDGVRR
jgi:UDP-N-acetyl-alpha-D-muramoyl-L-alanyl-L-glutamate epimerase